MVVFNDAAEALSGRLSVAVCDFAGDTIRSQDAEIEVESMSSLPISMASMAEWRIQPKDSYLSWMLEGKDKAPIVHKSALGCHSMKQTCFQRRFAFNPPATVIWQNPNLRSRGLLADIPGRWSDNGMTLEPHTRLTVAFDPEDSLAVLGEVKVLTLNPETLNGGL